MSFINGKIAEDLIENFLKDLECTTERSEGNFPDWDIKAKLKRKSFTVEVKLDILSQKTSNICIETHNTKQDKPSGIYATKADLWIFCLPDGDHITIWITSVKILKEYIKINKPFKTFEYAGDDNARILLYKESELLNIFDKVDHLSKEQSQKIIMKYLKS